MLPTTNLRTDIVLVRDSENKIKRIPVTKQQYNSIQQEKQDGNRSTLIAITDVDTGEKLFHGELGDIKGFEDIKLKDTSNMKWVCDFGSKHCMGEECKCTQIYKMYPTQFTQRAYKLFGVQKGISEVNENGRLMNRNYYMPIYSQDLTREEKIKIRG